MGKLSDLDQRILTVTGVSGLVRWARRNGPTYVAGLFIAGAAAGLLGIVSWAPFLIIAVALGLLYVAGTLLLVLVVTDDMNAQGRAGAIWGIAALLLGPLVGVLWLTVRREVDGDRNARRVPTSHEGD